MDGGTKCLIDTHKQGIYKWSDVGCLKSMSVWVLTGSPGVRMFEGECEAIVYSRQLDDGIFYYHPVCVLQGQRERN